MGYPLKIYSGKDIHMDIKGGMDRSMHNLDTHSGIVLKIYRYEKRLYIIYIYAPVRARIIKPGPTSREKFPESISIYQCGKILR